MVDGHHIVSLTEQLKIRNRLTALGELIKNVRLEYMTAKNNEFVDSPTPEQERFMEAYEWYLNVIED
jgi:hypothetical protein